MSGMDRGVWIEECRDKRQGRKSELKLLRMSNMIRILSSLNFQIGLNVYNV